MAGTTTFSQQIIQMLQDEQQKEQAVAQGVGQLASLLADLRQQLASAQSGNISAADQQAILGQLQQNVAEASTIADAISAAVNTGAGAQAPPDAGGAPATAAGV